jgi:hypothetical protein
VSDLIVSAQDNRMSLIAGIDRVDESDVQSDWVNEQEP